MTLDAKQTLYRVFNDSTNSLNVTIINTILPSILDTSVRDTTALQVDVINTILPVEDDNILGAIDSTTGVIKIMLTDDNARWAKIDEVAGSLRTITFPHAEVHEGHYFTFSNAGVLASGATRTYCIVTPDSDNWAHFIIQTSSSGKAHINFYEDCTATNIGTKQACFNKNRNSDTSNSTNIYLSPTMVGNGTKIHTEFHGAKQDSGYNRANEEWMLKQNAVYFFEIISDENTNNVSESFGWYEHINIF